MDARRHFTQLLVVWIALISLLAATACVGLLPWKSLHPALNLMIAAAKALLIGVFFMHLRSASALTRLIAAAGFFWLAILLGLGLSDYWTRTAL